MIEKNKLIYFPGIFVSLVGSVLFSFATGIYLLNTTKEGTSYALNIILYAVPIVILSPIFGILVDKYSKKKLIVGGDFLNALLMFGIYLLWDGQSHILLIYVGTVLTSIFSLLVSIGFESGKPQMFDREWLTKANSISSIINSGSRIIGPVLGGVVYAFIDIKTFILFNGLSFLFSTITECFLTIKEAKLSKEAKEKKSIKNGFRYMKSNSKLKKYISFLTVLNFAFPMTIMVAVPYIVINYFDYGSRVLGGIQSVFSVGIILGAIIIGKKNYTLSFGFVKIIFTSFVVLNLLFLIPLFVDVNKILFIGIYSIAMFLIGMVVASIDIPLFTYFQKELPDEIRGQVIGVFIGIVKTVVPIALLLSGKLMDLKSPSYSIIVGVLSVGICLVILMFSSEEEESVKEIVEEVN